MEEYSKQIKTKFESYSKISDSSWSLLKSLFQLKKLSKNDLLVRNGTYSKSIYFVCQGLLRAYFTNPDGDIYTKNLFFENNMAGSLVSSILEQPSGFTLEAMEDTILIAIDFKQFKNLISKQDDLKDFYIAYLEKNWVIDKESREISIILENAKERYLKLRSEHPNIDTRVAQQHIASHLGITPTQLSRIRKQLNKVI